MGLFSSKSSSSSSTTVETKDNRQVLDGGASGMADVGAGSLTGPAINITGGGKRSSVNVQVADAGIISAGMDYLREAEQAGTDRLELILGNTGKLMQESGAMVARTFDQMDALLAAKEVQDNPGAVTSNQVTILLAIAGGALLLLVLRLKK